MPADQQGSGPERDAPGLAGGEVAGYARLLVDSRNRDRERMWRATRAGGANAVVAMRFHCNEIGDVMSEVVAYGTAATVEPLDPAAASPESAVMRVRR